MSTTMENLRTAILGESKASATYAAFACKALQEGYPLIAKMFEATSKTERIHAANHTKALVHMGGQAPDYHIEIEVGATAENLRYAHANEVYEFSDMYPTMMAQAEAEGCKEALRSFSWAYEAEKEHAALFAEALRRLEDGEVRNLPKAYYICPLCGDTFPEDDTPDNCPLCGMSRDKFIRI